MIERHSDRFMTEPPGDPGFTSVRTLIFWIANVCVNGLSFLRPFGQGIHLPAQRVYVQ